MAWECEADEQLSLLDLLVPDDGLDFGAWMESLPLDPSSEPDGMSDE
jgi:hypothetical protein